MDRYPHEFSGGQRQRIGIVRALSVNPELVVDDQAVSALDVSIQAPLLQLLIELKEQRKLTHLFITHDLSVAEYLCDRVADLDQKGTRIVLQSDVPSPIDPPGGCPFHPRCAQAMQRCSHEVPALQLISPPERRAVKSTGRSSTDTSTDSSHEQTTVPGGLHTSAYTGTEQWAACHLLDETPSGACRWNS